MKIGSLLKKTLKRYRRGQGLVEFALIAPVLLVMLSGLMEFGFMLNEYLDILDGAREAARFASDDTPFDKNYNDENSFYVDAAILAERTMAPVSLCENVDGLGICGDDVNDVIHGDIVISVFGVADTSGGTVINRFPRTPVGAVNGEWRRFDTEASNFSTADVAAMLDANSPNTGIIIVEVFYNYPQKFKFPWITAFIPDPIRVASHTIMPLVAAEPTPTPLP